MAEEEKKFGVIEPNKGGNGKLASNTTGEDITTQYDYGNITESDKKVVDEIVGLLRDRGDIPCSMFAEELKNKFQLVEVPMKKIEDSVWGQLTKDERLGQSMQGFREAVDSDGNKIRIPHVGFSADLDYLDEFVNRLVNKVNKLNSK
tara:strand:+ start:39 stop:479 length:441 start_codon:yes stop_codon:yes gene_type:complete